MTSFCVHSYDEADALRRLILSSLPLADLIGEWVVLDHRSSDHTADVCEEMAGVLKSRGITMRTLREDRDFSAEFTFADVRNATIAACGHDVVVLLDADFILGPKFRAWIERARPALIARRSRYHAASYTVPVVWDRLAIDDGGSITDHGRVWVHQRRARILLRDAVHYEQTKSGGRWERLIHDRARPSVLALTPPRSAGLAFGTVVSVNVKSAERIALRDTMTMFLQDAVQGRASGGWLDNHHAGLTRSQGPYDYQDVDLRGWRVHSAAVTL